MSSRCLINIREETRRRLDELKLRLRARSYDSLINKLIQLVNTEELERIVIVNTFDQLKNILSIYNMHELELIKVLVLKLLAKKKQDIDFDFTDILQDIINKL